MKKKKKKFTIFNSNTVSVLLLKHPLSITTDITWDYNSTI